MYCCWNTAGSSVMYDVEGRRRLLLRGPASHKAPGPTNECDVNVGKCTETPASEQAGQAAKDRDADGLSADPRRISDMWDQHGNR
jgi:hypothetical protein